MDDPWNKSFLLLMGAFVANTTVLGLYIVPRARQTLCFQYQHGAGMSRKGSGGEMIFVITSNLASKLVARHKNKVAALDSQRQ